MEKTEKSVLMLNVLQHTQSEINPVFKMFIFISRLRIFYLEVLSIYLYIMCKFCNILIFCNNLFYIVNHPESINLIKQIKINKSCKENTPQLKNTYSNTCGYQNRKHSFRCKH